MAPTVEDKEEPAETHDDPDVNKTADPTDDGKQDE